uniref:Centrosomal protein of 19 kDa n=1 Tax=Trypanosoma congolense (strain IL3000) TaxID=1068625 RepID=G0UXK5_TRYCI|nr:conserved hypothetical protein [Trypanosoma congolense IL3000]
MQFLTDLGLELSVLVCHLYEKYREEPLKAFHELVLRTNHSSCSSEDDSNHQSLLTLGETSWYKGMMERYASLRRRLLEEHNDDVQEAREVTFSLYPQGCGVSEYADSIVTCAAMLTRSVPSSILQRFTACRVQELKDKGCMSVSVDELAHDLVERPVLDSLTPSRWWQDEAVPPAAAAGGPVELKKVAFRSQPLELLIVYSFHGNPRRRRIPLEGVLQESSPTATIVKRLVRTHGSLVSEAQLRSYIQRLQDLLRKSTENPPEAAGPEEASCSQHGLQPQPFDVNFKTHNVDLEGQRRSSQPSTSEVNKADVGLLYRDPEAALKNVDLNDADDITLQEFKAKMNEAFLQNALRPGDPGYVYDKRLEVNPTERSEWDDSD